MSFPMAPTLSMISEATERSESPAHSSYEPVAIPETSRYSDGYLSVGAAHTVPRTSIFSSETSYGEPLPTGHSMFKNLGLGLSMSHYDKSLPSLPRGSVTIASMSARSGQITESGRGSIVRSDASRHSLAKSESQRDSIASSRHSIVKSEASRHSAVPFELSRDPVDQNELRRVASETGQSPGGPRSSIHSDAKVASSKSSSAKSESDLVFEPVAEIASSSPLPSIPSRASSASSMSTVSTHSHTEPILKSRSHSSSISSSQSSSISSASTQHTLRTFDDIVDEVATSLAVRAKMHAETLPTSDRTKIGVFTTMSRGDDHNFMQIFAVKLLHIMVLHSSYLFALVPSGTAPATANTALIFCGQPQELVTRASILAGLRFKTRLVELQDTPGIWMGQLEPAGRLDSCDVYAQYEDVLWDIVRKAANFANPTEAPAGSRGIERILLDARARLDRLKPREAFAEAMRDGILVDIRPASQRAEHGTIPGALIIERNVLEWRFDPRNLDGRLPIADRYDLRVIVYCQEGYTSSLAAAALQDIGLWQATDLEGGFAHWKSEGLPVNALPVEALNTEYRSITPITPRQGMIPEE